MDNFSKNEFIPINRIQFTEEEREFQRECLDAHNMFRSLHGVPPLKLCDQLCSYATNWAMELAEFEELIYSSTYTLGENLYMAAGVRVSGTTPVRAWYNEERDYDYKLAKFSPYTGHFTQIVWKDTRELGVGIVRTESSSIVVCSYYPAGNESGLFRANVLDPKENRNQYQEDNLLVEYNAGNRRNRGDQSALNRYTPGNWNNSTPSNWNNSTQGNWRSAGGPSSHRRKSIAEDEVILFFIGVLVTIFLGALLFIKI